MKLIHEETLKWFIIKDNQSLHLKLIRHELLYNRHQTEFEELFPLPRIATT